ncbi:unnamed protein product, partial [Allacma fusca]
MAHNTDTQNLEDLE